MNTNKLWLVASLLILNGNAHAAFSAAELLKRCEASEQSVAAKTLTSEQALDSMWCVGYLSGLLDGFAVGDYKVDGEKMVCPPEQGLTRTDALAIILRHLRAHPETQTRNGRREALLALAKAMPCH